MNVIILGTVVVVIITIVSLIIILIYNKLMKNKENKSKNTNNLKNLYPYIDYLTDPRFTIRGGQGPQIVTYHEPEIVSIMNPSEQVLMQTYSGNGNNFSIRNLRYFQGECFSKFKDNVTAFYPGKSFCYIPSFIQPRYFSDALLDAVELFIHNLSVINIFCKCEMPMDSWFIEQSDVEFSSKLMEKFQTKLSNKSYMLSRGFDEKDSTISYVKLMEIPTETTIPVEISQNMEKLSKKQNVYVYIEFCYDIDSDEKLKVINLFPDIHELTSQIITKVIHDSIMGGEFVKQIYMFRFIINGDKLTNYIKINLVENAKMGIVFYIENNGKFRKINIPNTKYSFDADEFLLVSTINHNLYIQIEHSENMENHKSNIVEFILRVGRITGIPNIDIYNWLQNIGYQKYRDVNDTILEKLDYEFTGKITRNIETESAFTCSNESFMTTYVWRH